MIKKKNRVSRVFFDKIRTRKPLKATRTEVGVLKIYTQEDKTTRFSVVVGKKQEKSAVKRNQIKRALYPILKRTQKTPATYIFFVSRGFSNKEKDLLQKVADELN